MDRQFNTPVMILRALQLGLTIEDLDYLDYGLLQDIVVEKSNDDYKYPVLATQDDYDNF